MIATPNCYPSLIHNIWFILDNSVYFAKEKNKTQQIFNIKYMTLSVCKLSRDCKYTYIYFHFHAIPRCCSSHECMCSVKKRERLSLSFIRWLLSRVARSLAPSVRAHQPDSFVLSLLLFSRRVAGERCVISASVINAAIRFYLVSKWLN